MIAFARPAPGKKAARADSARDFKPIFVLGIQRSGTTWLANMLAAHPLVAAVEAERHHGVHESVFFSHFARAYGDLTRPAAWDRFVKDFERSDYFRLTGVEGKWLREHAASKSYSDVFRNLMDEFAHRRGAVAWLEKSPHHTLLAEELQREYPAAYFVCITRRTTTLVRSRLWSYGRVPPANPARTFLIAKACAANAFYGDYLRRFCAGNPRAMLVTYEDLSRDLEPAMLRVLGFLGLPPDATVLRPPYKPNSSFNGQVSAKAALTAADRAAVAVFTAVMGLFPEPVLAAIRRRTIRAEAREFPKWVWDETQDHMLG
ncbi:sulfotransferase [Mesorhizobium mediterraneum]|uniref:sulfotransferase n=1 Tax=Mesorhizobium mediterraneum TaxID=43617 RepID=UPI00177AB403